MKNILSIPRSTKQLLMILVDVLIVLLSIYLAYSLRWGKIWYFPDEKIILAFVLGPIIAIPIFYIFGFYNMIVRYMSFESLRPLLYATVSYSIIWSVLVWIFNIYAFPRSVGIINFLLLIFIIFTSRLLVIWLITNLDNKIVKQVQNILIYGAGSGGNKLLSILSQNNNYRIIGFIDSDRSLKNKKLKDKKIFHHKQIDSVIRNNRVDIIYFAIPSISGESRKEIITDLLRYKLPIKTVPNINELISKDFNFKDLRSINIEDLLGREQVEINDNLINSNNFNKVIMVTGAGGSVGSEICRQIIKLKPSKLVLYESNEFSLYKIHNELIASLGKSNIKYHIIPILGSVCDKIHLKKVILEYRVQTVYHAAAYKHVPLLEENIIPAIYNNVFGTINCYNMSREHGVKNFVLISTDKAVNPASLMGATKRIAEAYIQIRSKKNNDSASKFKSNIVRFGNVLGSSGSVIPLFKDQIKDGGPVTVTSKEITRYFMTITEAAQLVIQAGGIGDNGSIYVLDMGKPIKIIDLAKKMIELSGFNATTGEKNTENDIRIKLIGLRNGEKNFEELYYNSLQKTLHPKIFRENYTIDCNFDFDNLIKILNKHIVENNEKLAKRKVFDSINMF